MRALVCRAWGGPRDLVIEDRPPPPLAAGCVRIRVRAAGVNFADTLMIAGRYQTKPELPFSPGLEVAGEATECAPDVRRVRPGGRVIALTSHGGLAEEVCVPESAVFPMPSSMDWTTAAAFPVVYATAHIGLFDLGGLKKGEVLLVLGAAGGVGLAAVEIGKLAGASVIAAAGGPDKLAIVREHGADVLIDSRTEDVRARVRAMTKDRGADVVFDPVGGPAFDAALRATAPGGRILIVGFAGGTIQQIPANQLLIRNVAAIGFTVGHWRLNRPEGLGRALAELAVWHADGRLKPRISHTFPLARAAEALEVLMERRAVGKVVVTMGDVGHGPR